MFEFMEEKQGNVEQGAEKVNALNSIQDME